MYYSSTPRDKPSQVRNLDGDLNPAKRWGAGKEGQGVTLQSSIRGGSAIKSNLSRLCIPLIEKRRPFHVLSKVASLIHTLPKQNVFS